MVGTDENMQRASDAAVRRIVREMVAAVLSLVDRYPNVATSISAAPRS